MLALDCNHQNCPRLNLCLRLNSGQVKAKQASLVAKQASLVAQVVKNLPAMQETQV